MTRDPNGIIWFNVNPGRGGLGRLDPKTEKIDVYLPPTGMSPTGGATTVDYDGKGRIWASAPDGALRFDPKTEKFTEFKSVTYKTPNGTGITYGAAADRDGNGYWAEMVLDIIGVGDGATGKATEIKLPPVKAEMDSAAAGRARNSTRPTISPTSTIRCRGRRVRAAWAPTRTPTCSGSAIPGAPISPASTPTRTRRRYVPLPGEQQPYHVAVDKNHNAWTNLWGADRVMRYDPDDRTLDRVRPADPRRRAALRLAARTRRPADAGRAALFPRPQGRGDDAAQRGRHRRAQGAGGRSNSSVIPGRGL